MVIPLHNNDIALIIDPQRGGGILRFDWRDQPIFHPARMNEEGPLALANFVMVPFSNRIANGQFSFNGQSVTLVPNYPAASAQHPIHGHGWTGQWQIVAKSEDTLHLRYEHPGGRWPWLYVCDQIMTLTPDGYLHRVSITNTGEITMPAGLGFHPYFPRSKAKLHTSFDGFWQTSGDGLPTRWISKVGPYCLSDDDPVDTVFTGRKSPLLIDWPQHQLIIEPDFDLPETHIFAPAGEDYFCIEPVSHITDAINRGGLRTVEAGETWSTQVQFCVTEKDPQR